jgi:hypothetical protein
MNAFLKICVYVTLAAVFVASTTAQLIELSKTEKRIADNLADLGSPGAQSADDEKTAQRGAGDSKHGQETSGSESRGDGRGSGGDEKRREPVLTRRAFVLWTCVMANAWLQLVAGWNRAHGFLWWCRLAAGLLGTVCFTTTLAFDLYVRYKRKRRGSIHGPVSKVG